MHFQYIREKAASFMICKKLEWFHSSFLVLNQLPEGYILLYGVITCVIGQKNLGMGCVLRRSSGFLWPQINLLVSSDLLKPRTYSLLKLRTNETKIKNTEKNLLINWGAKTCLIVIRITLWASSQTRHVHAWFFFALLLLSWWL